MFLATLLLCLIDKMQYLKLCHKKYTKYVCPDSSGKGLLCVSQWLLQLSPSL